MLAFPVPEDTVVRALHSTVVLAAVLAAACGSGVPGERQSCYSCPEGERCARECGLSFDGPRDHGALTPVAVGGTMPVKVIGFDDWSRAAARTDTDAISVRGSRLPELTLFGEALGSGHLRIVEASTGLLYDRVDIRSAQVADAEIFVSEFSDREAYGLIPGEPVGVHTLLADNAGNSVVDSSQRITAEQNGTVEVIPLYGGVTPVAGAPVTIRVAAGYDFSKEIRRDVFVPDGITTYLPVGPSPPLDLEAGLEVDASGDICFRLMNGQLPLAGGKMNFTVSGNLFLGHSWTCVYVYGEEPGPAYIEATYGSLVTRVEFNVFE